MVIRLIRRRLRLAVATPLQIGLFAYYSGLGMPFPTALILSLICGRLLSRMIVG